jgi:hypothetical protein
MGLSVPHGQGRLEQAYVVAQTALGTPVFPAGTDAIRILKSEFKRKRNRKPHEHKRATRDLLQRYTSRVEASWMIEKMLMPSGVAGTAPDDDDLWIGGIGTKTVVGGTSVTYGLSSAQAPTKMLSIVSRLNDAAMQHAEGAFVGTTEIEVSGDGEAKVKFSGPCRDVLRVGGVAEVSGGHILGETVITLTSPQGRRFYNGAKVQFESNTGTRLTNSGAGYTVSGVSATGFTISPGLEAAINSGNDVYPFSPTETTAGTPIDGIVGSLTIDGSECFIKSAKIKIDNHLVLETNRYGTAYLADVNTGKREVTGTIMVELRRDQAQYLTDLDTYPARAVVLVIGSGAGTICTITMSAVEFDTSDLDVPEGASDEVATYEIPFVALGTGAGENSISIAFT